jgi:PKD repeat protein
MIKFAKQTFVIAALALLLVCLLPVGLFAFAQTGTITYNAASNTINVSGFNASNPATFTALWKQSQTSGWGVVQQQGGNQFIFSCLINVASDCFLNDTDVQIILASGVVTANGQYFIGGLGTVTFGKVVDYNSKTSGNGVNFYCPGQGYWFYWIWTKGGEYIYSSTFNCNGWNIAIVYATNLWNSIATGKGFAGFHAESNSDFFNVICSNTHFGIYFDSNSISAKYDKISLLSVDFAVRNWGNGNGATISNVYARNCTTLFGNEDLNVTINQYLVNFDVDNWTFAFVSLDSAFPQTSISTIYRQYTFDLTVTNPNGTAIPNAVVNIIDFKGTQVISTLTDSSGRIPTKALSLGFYNNTGGAAIYQVAPYSLKITAAGYTDYTIYIPATQKSDWHISLQPVVTRTWIISRFTDFCPNIDKRTVLFDGSYSNASSEITSYYWDFGDGGVSSSVSIDHTYNATGNYTVTLTVTNSDGSNSFSQNINLPAVNTASMFPWWWALIALLILLLLLLLLILLLWNRRNVVVIQAYVPPQETCSESDVCDNCEIKPS